MADKSNWSVGLIRMDERKTIGIRATGSHRYEETASRQCVSGTHVFYYFVSFHEFTGLSHSSPLHTYISIVSTSK